METKKINILKYFVKHFGCRLACNNIKVPTNFIKFLNGEIEYFPLRISFEISKDFHYVIKDLNHDYNLIGSAQMRKINLKQNGSVIGHGIKLVYNIQWYRFHLNYSPLFNGENKNDFLSYYDTLSITDRRQNVVLEHLTQKELDIYLTNTLMEEAGLGDFGIK